MRYQTISALLFLDVLCGEHTYIYYYIINCNIYLYTDRNGRNRHLLLNIDSPLHHADGQTDRQSQFNVTLCPFLLSCLYLSRFFSLSVSISIVVSLCLPMYLMLSLSVLYFSRYLSLSKVSLCLLSPSFSLCFLSFLRPFSFLPTTDPLRNV